jgi:hypothetical protein
MEWAVGQWLGNDKKPKSMSEAAGAAEVSGGGRKMLQDASLRFGDDLLCCYHVR